MRMHDSLPLRGVRSDLPELSRRRRVRSRLCERAGLVLLHQWLRDGVLGVLLWRDRVPLLLLYDGELRRRLPRAPSKDHDHAEGRIAHACLGELDQWASG